MVNSHLNLQLAGGAELLEGALSRRCGFTKLLSRFDTRSGVTGTASFPPDLTSASGPPMWPPDLRCRACEHNWPRPGPPALLEMFIWAQDEAALGQSQASGDHNHKVCHLLRHPRIVDKTYYIGYKSVFMFWSQLFETKNLIFRNRQKHKMEGDIKRTHFIIRWSSHLAIPRTLRASRWG